MSAIRSSPRRTRSGTNRNNPPQRVRNRRGERLSARASAVDSTVGRGRSGRSSSSRRARWRSALSARKGSLLDSRDPARGTGEPIRRRPPSTSAHRRSSVVAPRTGAVWSVGARGRSAGSPLSLLVFPEACTDTVTYHIWCQPPLDTTSPGVRQGAKPRTGECEVLSAADPRQAYHSRKGSLLVRSGRGGQGATVVIA